jgi:hypothetical protein
MNANFGLLDPLEVGQQSLPRATDGGGRGAGRRLSKERKKQLLVERAQTDFAVWMDEAGVRQQKQMSHG